MFLYRDDYYNKDTELKGIAEIIIAKQRNGPIGTVKMAWIPEQTRFADLAKKTSYTVGEAIREENGTYQVVLTVKPITLLKDTYAEFQEKAQEYATKVSNDVMNGQAMPEETQMQTEIYQIYYEVLSQAAEKGLKYGKPNKIVLHVEKDKEGKYEIRKADLQNLDHLLIESVGEEQDEENS